MQRDCAKYGIAFLRLLFPRKDSPLAETLKVKGIVYDSFNIKNLVKATSDALAPTKTTEEKDLFAGLNIGVPSTNGAVQGDIVITRMRPGLKATFQRGYLPPVFARTRVFTYGFVLESLK